MALLPFALAALLGFIPTAAHAELMASCEAGSASCSSSEIGDVMLQRAAINDKMPLEVVLSEQTDGDTAQDKTGEVHDMLAVESREMTENIEGVPGYDEKKKQNCAGNNLDMHEHEAQCFKNPDSNGGSQSYGADSNALCLNKDQCAKLCSETATCEVVEMHRTKNRCYLNTGACVEKAAQSSSSNYDLLFRADHYWEIFYEITRFRSTGCGNDAGGAAEQVWYGSIGGCDTGCKIKDPAYEDLDKVNTIHFSTGLCRKTFHAYQQDPYKVEVGIKAFEADRTFGDICKKGNGDDCAVDYTEKVELKDTNGLMTGRDVCSGKHCVHIAYLAKYITAAVAPDCRAWCEGDSRAWGAKCIFKVCSLCSKCEATGPCEGWCWYSTKTWDTKCSFANKCGGCAPCSWNGTEQLG